MRWRRVIPVTAGQEYESSQTDPFSLLTCISIVSAQGGRGRRRSSTRARTRPVRRSLLVDQCCCVVCLRDAVTPLRESVVVRSGALSCFARVLSLCSTFPGMFAMSGCLCDLERCCDPLPHHQCSAVDVPLTWTCVVMLAGPINQNLVFLFSTVECRCAASRLALACWSLRASHCTSCLFMPPAVLVPSCFALQSRLV